MKRLLGVALLLVSCGAAAWHWLGRTPARGAVASVRWLSPPAPTGLRAEAWALGGSGSKA